MWAGAGIGCQGRGYGGMEQQGRRLRRGKRWAGGGEGVGELSSMAYGGRRGRYVKDW